MADAPINGHDPSRMDRLEASQEKLLHGMQQLLTAQVLLTDTVDKTVKTVEKTAKTLDAFIEQTNKRFQEMGDSHLETDEKLNALIGTVDHWIRLQPPPPGPAA